MDGFIPVDSGELVEVGRIHGPHGIRGELKVESQTDFPERFAPGSHLLLVAPDGRVRPTVVLSSRVHKNRYLLTVEGIEDRTAAENLRGGFLKVGQEDLTPLPPGRYYQFQLLGLSVVTDEGRALGPVEDVFPTGGNLVLVVRGEEGELLLPYIDDVVLKVDLDEGRITVHLLDGLLAEG
jgi:16S rRNA processing protein RimM